MEAFLIMPFGTFKLMHGFQSFFYSTFALQISTLWSHFKKRWQCTVCISIRGASATRVLWPSNDSGWLYTHPLIIVVGLLNTNKKFLWLLAMPYSATIRSACVQPQCFHLKQGWKCCFSLQDKENTDKADLNKTFLLFDNLAPYFLLIWKLSELKCGVAWARLWNFLVRQVKLNKL